MIKDMTEISELNQWVEKLIDLKIPTQFTSEFSTMESTELVETFVSFLDPDAKSQDRHYTTTVARLFGKSKAKNIHALFTLRTLSQGSSEIVASKILLICFT